MEFNDDNLLSVMTCVNNKGFEDVLTEGKKYPIIDDYRRSGVRYIIINNDNGYRQPYRSDNFVNDSQYNQYKRNKKLEEIGINEDNR